MGLNIGPILTRLPTDHPLSSPRKVAEDTGLWKSLGNGGHSPVNKDSRHGYTWWGLAPGPQQAVLLCCFASRKDSELGVMKGE